MLGLASCRLRHVIPMIVGPIGLGVFLLSMLAGCVPLLAGAWWRRRDSGSACWPGARSSLPLGGVVVGFLVLLCSA